MKTIDIYTYPHGKADQYSQDTIVSFLQPNGRFTDIQVGELCDGDQYFIPKRELVLSTDTEILDFLVKNQPKIGWTVSEFKWKGESCVHAFKRESLEDIGERSAVLGDTADLLGAFRELFTEIINNEEL